ncbi:hypothetical protein BSUW23_09665 [Bacillus spizizenii str. W23]|uniref:Uncharacterized protein n=2 Tax=Bacillaceae TaxID=186817 RepID=E0TX73_BACSH|nr:hypothetical protein [Bacillus spizizenii]ADM37979.1 hypothetical protein BSUW23_09665 [Bacillus spizizenii str. W23]EFG93121.1 hypothetical protein BSU6633_05689 [Bacillus spizizenii ATCC 6633 = JCM 2499]OOE22022.1 hypothetical protein BSR82_04790 [Bacillus subtilis]MBE0174243.1 hypothetical protein [Bacillus spizizenii]MBT3130116.1 hypothetical protein [Bacillus spizizenii]
MKKIIWNKYVKFAVIFIVSLLVIILGAFFFEWINKPIWSSNFIVFSSYVLMYYYLISVLISPLEQVKPPEKLYHWLNNPIIYEQDSFLKDLKEVDIDKKNLLENLNNFRVELLIYTNHDLTKLRMLKAHVRTKNTEGSLDTINRTLIALLAGPLFLFVIKNNSIIEYLKIPIKNANQELISIMTVLLILLFFLSIIINFVFLFSGNKTRLKFIEEMADACIEELKTK